VSEKTKRETWRDWLPPDAPPPTHLLTREEVVARLQEAGIKASVDDLRFWEQEGILPHPVRQRHKGATRAVHASPHDVGSCRDSMIAFRSFCALARADQWRRVPAIARPSATANNSCCRSGNAEFRSSNVGKNHDV